MFNNLLVIIVLIFISLIPIIFWGYTFSHINSSSLNKKRFLFGIGAGVLSVLPILYLDKIRNIFDTKYLDLSHLITNISSFSSILDISLSLSLFLFIFVIISFGIGIIFNKFSEISRVYIKSILVFLLFIGLLAGIFLFIDFIGTKFQFLNSLNSESLYFSGVFLDSLKLVIFYYLIVAFLEEASKYFGFLGSKYLSINSLKEGIVYAIFVALGFSFIENILYLYGNLAEFGFSFSLLKLYFFRSIFSIILHILCSTILAFSFLKSLSYLKQNNNSFSYIKIFLTGIIFSVLLHSSFDIFLTLGFSFIIILYLIGGYLYVSSLFYRE